MTTPHTTIPYYFLHIHKTAGMTFTSILENNFPPDEVCKARQWHELLVIPPDERSRYRLFAGHFHHCFHSLLPEMPIYLTFLRDPVERVLSRYAHLQRDSAHYLHPHVANMPLREFLRHPLTRPQVQNLQVRTIAYDFDILALRNTIPGELTTALEMEAAINRMFGDLPDNIDDDLVLPALERIRGYAFVGISEQFEASLKLMSATFGWQPVTDYQNRNVSSQRLQRQDIAPDVIGEIGALNYADMALYYAARRLFEARLREI